MGTSLKQNVRSKDHTIYPIRGVGVYLSYPSSDRKTPPHGRWVELVAGPAESLVSAVEELVSEALGLEVLDRDEDPPVVPHVVVVVTLQHLHNTLSRKQSIKQAIHQ